MEIIKTLVSVENIIGVYRNYWIFEGRVKHLVKFYILIHICLLVVTRVQLLLKIWNLITFEEELAHLCQFSAISVMTINSIIAIMYGLCTCCHFKRFVTNMSDVYALYVDDLLHQRFLSKQWRQFYIDALLFTIAIASVFINIVFETLSFRVIEPKVTLVTSFISEFRFIYENFIFYELIKTIAVFLIFLNKSISIEISKAVYLMDGKRDEMQKGAAMQRIRTKLEKWSKASRYLVAASDHIGHCFWVQLAVALFSSIILYVTLWYRGITITLIQKSVLSRKFARTLHLLIFYLLMKIFILTAGQLVQNESKKMIRKLLSLRNILIKIPGSEAGECARAAAGLARRLRAAPLRVRLLSARAVQMALLVDILAFVANYTVVLLQFNHIV